MHIPGRRRKTQHYSCKTPTTFRRNQSLMPTMLSPAALMGQKSDNEDAKSDADDPVTRRSSSQGSKSNDDTETEAP